MMKSPTDETCQRMFYPLEPFIRWKVVRAKRGSMKLPADEKRQLMFYPLEPFIRWKVGKSKAWINEIASG